MFQTRLPFVLLITVWLVACASETKRSVALPATPSAHTLAIEEWRDSRQQRLKAPDGWLSLVALSFLQDGQTTLGSNPGSDIVLTSAPPRLGTVAKAGDHLSFHAAPDVGATVNGEPIEHVALVRDDQGEPTEIRVGSIVFYAVLRGETALRIKDSQAPTRTRFSQLDYFPIDPSWALEARFVPHPPGQTIEVLNVLGQIEPMDNPGRLVFSKDGREYDLEVVDSGATELFVIFADRTSGRDTYGAGRFVYVPRPIGGMTSIDFNKAYNPPCVFTDYSTCSLPPRGNRLDLAVTAGEMDYRGMRPAGR